MLGLRSHNSIANDLEKSTHEIERLTKRVGSLRKELVLAEKYPEIQSILEAQSKGPWLRDGSIASPTEILKERLGTDFVSLQHATGITDTYRDLRASLKVQDRNVRLASYGEESMSHERLMGKLFASETLRELLRYKNEDIGKFVAIESTGYVTIIR